MNSSAVQGDNEEISEIKILNNKKKNEKFILY